MNANQIHKEIKILSLAVDDLLTGTAKKNRNEYYKVLSVQLINFGGENDLFEVYDNCSNLPEYEDKLIEYFQDKTKRYNKSLLNLIKATPQSDDGIWYKLNESNIPFLKSKDPHKLSKNFLPDVFASFYDFKKKKKYNKYDISKEIWNSWCHYVFVEIYPKKAKSILMKKIEVEISKGYKIYSALVFCFTEQIGHKNVAVISSLSETLLNKIAYKKLIPSLYENSIRQATRAAISQVMARNMSHNIGSHVLSKLVSATAVKKALINNAYRGLDNIDDRNIDEQIAYFNSYLKTRMDFLADIATNTPTLETTKQLYNDVLLGLDRNRILLTHISGVNNFEFSLQIINHTKDGEVQLDKDNDLSIAVPSDILGCHAIYIIIENIIRNTAKHGHSTAKKDYKFIMIIEDVSSEFYKATIHDDVVIPNKGDNPLSDLEKQDSKVTRFCKDGNIGKLDCIVYHQNINLNKSILKSEDNTLRLGAWGLIEMDVSAAYLRKIPVENVDGDKYSLDPYEHLGGSKNTTKNEFSIFKAVKVKSTYLGYEFYLPKPKNYLVIHLSNKLISKAQEKKANEKGIYFLHADIFKEKIKTSVFTHQMLVVCKDIELSVLLNSFSSSLPYRRIADVSVYEFLKQEYNQIDIEAIDKFCWQIWLDKRMTKLSIEKINVFASSKSRNTDCITIRKSGNDCINEFNACLNDHGDTWKTEKANRCEMASLNFLEYISSRNTSLLPNYVDGNLAYTYCPAGKPRFILADSLCYKVCVVDERIQESSFNPANVFSVKCKDGSIIDISFNDIHRFANIVIPPVDIIDLNNVDFTLIDVKTKKSGKTNFEMWLSEKCKQFDFVVIHLGIIEKLLKGFGKDYINIQNYISKEIKRHNEDVEIIVISGRGKPHNLPKEQKFMNYSVISDCLIEDRSIYKFVNNIIAAKRL